MDPEVISPAEIAFIFGSIPMLIEVNKTLLEDLEKAVVMGDESWLGPVFLHFAPFLKLYSQYVMNFLKVDVKVKSPGEGISWLCFSDLRPEDLSLILASAISAAAPAPLCVSRLLALDSCVKFVRGLHSLPSCEDVSSSVAAKG